ncbi:MAG: CBS domain-containing protein [Novosphingobium sp.]
MNVASILREKGNTIVSVLPETPLMEIVTTIASRRIGAVLVRNESGELVGIVSERDVVKALAANGTGLDSLAARDVMTPNVTTVTPQTSINEAMELMDRGYFRHLPVLDGGALVGIVSVRDVVRARIDKHVEEAESMISYINSRV